MTSPESVWNLAQGFSFLHRFLSRAFSNANLTVSLPCLKPSSQGLLPAFWPHSLRSASTARPLLPGLPSSSDALSLHFLLSYPSQPLRTQVRKTTAISAAGTDKRVNKGSRKQPEPGPLLADAEKGKLRTRNRRLLDRTLARTQVGPIRHGDERDRFHARKPRPHGLGPRLRLTRLCPRPRLISLSLVPIGLEVITVLLCLFLGPARGIVVGTDGFLEGHPKSH